MIDITENAINAPRLSVIQRHDTVIKINIPPLKIYLEVFLICRYNRKLRETLQLRKKLQY